MVSLKEHYPVFHMKAKIGSKNPKVHRCLHGKALFLIFLLPLIISQPLRLIFYTLTGSKPSLTVPHCLEVLLECYLLTFNLYCLVIFASLTCLMIHLQSWNLSHLTSPVKLWESIWLWGKAHSVWIHFQGPADGVRGGSLLPLTSAPD